MLALAQGSFILQYNIWLHISLPHHYQISTNSMRKSHWLSSAKVKMVFHFFVCYVLFCFFWLISNCIAIRCSNAKQKKKKCRKKCKQQKYQTKNIGNNNKNNSKKLFNIFRCLRRGKKLMLLKWSMMASKLFYHMHAYIHI